MIYEFVPRAQEDSTPYQCTICDMTIYRSIAIDHWPICAMCRWFCSVEDRWGRKHDGITNTKPRESENADAT